MTIGGTTRMSWRGKLVLLFLMVLFSIYFLIPLYVMVSNSVKHLAEIRAGNMMALPQSVSFEYWARAWSSAQIGVQPIGLRPYFINSIRMAVPAVFLSTAIGALAGFVLSHWRLRHSSLIFGLILFGAFIPFQSVLIPMARVLGTLGISGTVTGLVLVHTVYGVAFTTLFFRNSFAGMPHQLVQAAQVDGARFGRIFLNIMLPNASAVIAVSVIWQTTNIWNDFLFGASFGGARGQPLQVALNNLVSASTGVVEYNVHFAGALIAALPTLVIYVLAGRYFVSGLMSGSVKG